MSITGAGEVDASTSQYYEEPLLNSSSSSDHRGELLINGDEEEEEEDYKVDYSGERVIINNQVVVGRWRSASLIIVVDIAEAMAYYGISSNLINYLTGPLHQSTVTAAANINTWVGFIWMLPVFGAFVADSYLGRFRTILFSTLIYILGLGLLTLSVVLPSVVSQPASCPNNSENNTTSCTFPSSFPVTSFFSSLYLVAIGRAGFKPCVQAFGADQFDGRNPEECKSKSSFFNWWYLGLCFGSSISFLIITYIQDNLSWGLGFSISWICLVVALIVFLFGTKTYRYSAKKDKENPLLRIAQVFVVAGKNWRISSSSAIIEAEQQIGMSHRIRVGVHQFKFLDKALIDTSKSNDPLGSRKYGIQCNINQVEDAKVVLRLVPIWLTCLIYAVVFAQSSTFFIKQGNVMDRSIGSGFKIPAASLQILINLSIFLFIPIYDRVFVPFARVFTSKPNGITMLQRIGGGIFISTISIVTAAVIEKRRLSVALDFGLIDRPEVTVPMSVWWLAPQYLLFGLADVFTIVGLQEFFYDQVPDALKSVGVSLYLSILGIGSFLSGFLISVIENITGGSDHYSWFSNNLNRAHLDYFFWLLAGLSLAELAVFLYFSKSYLYKRGTST